MLIRLLVRVGFIVLIWYGIYSFSSIPLKMSDMLHRNLDIINEYTNEIEKARFNIMLNGDNV